MLVLKSKQDVVGVPEYGQEEDKLGEMEER